MFLTGVIGGVMENQCCCFFTSARDEGGRHILLFARVWLSG